MFQKRIFATFLVRFCLFLLLFIAAVNTSAAEGEFRTDLKTTYYIQTNGNAHVVMKIALTNNFSEIYAASYTLLLGEKKVSNVVALQDGATIPVRLDVVDQSSRVIIDFPDAVVGKGKSRNFSVEYDIPQFAEKNGEVWEFSLPKLAENASFNQYSVTVVVPKALGKLAYISPEPESHREDNSSWVYVFSKKQLSAIGAVAAFGEFQIFDFTLKYHLLNPYSKLGETEIALIPDTAFQRVYYSNISPKPYNVHIDEDGNWLAVYRLGPNETKDVSVSGSVQLFSTPQSNYLPVFPRQRSYYLESSKFWQIDNPDIVRLAKKLQTPKQIYDFVVKTLDYDYSRVKEGVERLGAAEALSRPKNAICMEFTDLFIALSRAAGIPSREINGFAYTDDPETQPLSLVTDVLHAWPEYWDSKLQVWHPVDPTWGKTTGGIDYFNKFDLSHIVFAIHGKNAELPLPAGSYKLTTAPQKDIRVEFGQLPQKRSASFKIKIQESKVFIPFWKTKLDVTVENIGSAASYNIPVRVSATGVDILKTDKTSLDYLVPFGKTQFSITFRDNLLIRVNSKTITISAGDGQEQVTYRYKVPFEAQLLNLTIVFIIIFSFTAMVFLLLRVHKK